MGKPTAMKPGSKRPADGVNSDDDVTEDDQNNIGGRVTRSQAKRFKAKKIPVFHNKIKPSGSFFIETSNKYQPLAGNSNEIILPKHQQQQVKKEKVPPIVTTTLQRKDIIEKLKSLEISTFSIKNTSIGIYINVDSAANHLKFRQHLDEKKVAYFSHDLPGDKQIKMVLRDLGLMDINELKLELEALGLKPAEIKVIKPKHERYAEHVNYIVFFNHDQYDSKKLYQTNRINYTSVRWEKYRSSYQGPTQCRRCLQFGHGTRNCKLDPHCQYCTESHLSEDCEKIGKEIDAIQSQEAMETGTEPSQPKKIVFAPKCFNCGGDHVALSDKCKKRAEYTTLQKSISQRNRQPQKRGYISASDDFPALKSSNGVALRGATSSRQAQQPRAAQQPRQTRPSFPNISFSSILSNSNSYSNPNNDPTTELFSYDEIINVVTDIITGLSGCKSKLEQFQVITSLTFKYVYGQSP